MLDYGVQTPGAPLVGLTGKIPPEKGTLHSSLTLGQLFPGKPLSPCGP